MKSKSVFVLAFLGGLFLLTGCNQPVPAVPCPPGDLVAPWLTSPYSYAKLADTTPTLSWKFEAVTYPYPEPYPTPSPEYFCYPQSFRISLSTAPYFTDELGSVVGGTIPNLSWTTHPLQSGKTYRWNVMAVSQGIDGPVSETRYFSVGEACTTLEVPAVLLSPPDGSTVDTLTPVVMFDTLMDCLPDGFLVEYSQDSDFAHKGTYGGSGYYGYGMTLPELLNCTTYYWRVVPWHIDFNHAGVYSDVWSFNVQKAGTMCVSFAPVPSLIPEKFPTQPPDPSDFIWEVILDANCRQGPGKAYNELGFVLASYLAPIEGRNEDGSWFRVRDAYGISCWVSRIALQVPEEWELAKILGYPAEPPPATHTPEPVYNCSQHNNDYNACIAHPECQYDRKTLTCSNK